MLKRQWYLLSLLAVVGIFVLVALTSANTNNAGNMGGNGNPLGVLRRPRATSFPPGIPGITPRMKSVSGTAHTYTSVDVESYLRTKSSESASLASHQAVIVNIAFITAHQASELLGGEFIGRPDTVQVCYAELHGIFKVIAGPDQKTPVAVHRVIYIFDAQTGNLLLRSIGD